MTLLFSVLLLALPAYAQEPPVTIDDVNAVASRMYCPECEMIPLDKCGLQVCIDWKNEIARQLGEGRTPDQIVADFATRYGDRVVGIPQNPTIRALALYAPPILAVMVALFGVWAIFRLRRGAPATPVTVTPEHVDEYRARLQRDLEK